MCRIKKDGCFVKRLMKLEERKKVAFDILIDIDNICKRNNIPYYLAYGTLIGAIRHKGFIPWDDDIDIWIPSECYERLLAKLEAESIFSLKNHTTDNDWPGYFSKLYDPNTIIVDKDSNKILLPRGVAVDLFVLTTNKRGDKWDIRFAIYKKMIFWQYKLKQRFCHGNKSLNNIIIRIVSLLCYYFGMDQKFWRRKLFELQTLNSEGCYVGCAGSPYGNRDIFSKEDFAKIIKVAFEGKFFNVPIGYDNILTSLYGDYMKLPPEEKRISNHDVEAYWIK